jgi:hypothetical protein
MPFTAVQILAGIVMPAVLLGLAMLAAWRPWSRRATADARWIFAPVVGIGYCIAYWNLEPRPGWPPGSNVLFLLFYIAIPLAVFGLLDAILKPPLWLRAVVIVLLWQVFVRWLLLPQIPRQISGPNAELWIDALSVIALVWWLTFERLADRAPGVTTPLILAATAAASAILLAMGWHIQASGAMAGSLVGMSVAAMVLAAWNSRISFSRGFAQTIALLLQFILVHGYFYTGDTLTTRQQILAAVFMASPLLAFTGDLPVIRRRHSAWRLAARVIPVVIALGIVTAATIRDYVQADESQPTMQDE